jgi:hypothetical protein
MKYLRDATYVVGGYVVRDGRVLLLWHGGLARWVPTGGRIELASGEATPLPMPVSIQEIRISATKEYLDFVYFCDVVDGELSLDYRAARAYHWFSKDDLERFPLMPHVFAYASRALEELSPGPIDGDVPTTSLTRR